MLWTWEAGREKKKFKQIYNNNPAETSPVCDDCGPNIAATPVFMRWQTRFDAWKLSWGIILSISAWSFERWN